MRNRNSPDFEWSISVAKSNGRFYRHCLISSLVFQTTGQPSWLNDFLLFDYWSRYWIVGHHFVWPALNRLITSPVIEWSDQQFDFHTGNPTMPPFNFLASFLPGKQMFNFWIYTVHWRAQKCSQIRNIPVFRSWSENQTIQQVLTRTTEPGE